MNRSNPPTSDPRRWSTAHRVIVAAVVVAAATMSACSISRDDSPRVIDRDAIPELRTPTTVPAPQGGSAEVDLFFPNVAGDRLIPVVRSAESSQDAHAILQQLINGPTREEQQDYGVTTSIPAGTKLLGTRQEPGDDLLIVDLNEGIDSVEGPGLINAYAQIVWTATNIPGINRVKFSVNGEDRQGATDSGPRDVLSVGDFGGANRTQE